MSAHIPLLLEATASTNDRAARTQAALVRALADEIARGNGCATATSLVDQLDEEAARLAALLSSDLG